MQHDTTPPPLFYRLADLPRVSSDLLLPTHLRGLPVILPPSSPDPPPPLFLNCPGARLGKNSLAIRFIFSRHEEIHSLLPPPLPFYPRCTKNRAVIVSHLTLNFFFTRAILAGRVRINRLR